MSTFNQSVNQLVFPALSAVRHQPVAKKSVAARRKHIRRITIIFAAGVLLALAYVWIRIQVIQLGYEVSKIRRETTELKEQKNMIGAEVEKLKSPTRIELVARDNFGMRLPLSDEVVIVER